MNTGITLSSLAVHLLSEVVEQMTTSGHERSAAIDVILYFATSQMEAADGAGAVAARLDQVGAFYDRQALGSDRDLAERIRKVNPLAAAVQQLRSRGLSNLEISNALLAQAIACAEQELGVKKTAHHLLLVAMDYARGKAGVDAVERRPHGH